MSRIFIDLTDLELWQGNHGGTQRVVYGIARQFFLNQPDLSAGITYISFSSRDGSYYQTSFEPIQERVRAHLADKGRSTSILAIDLSLKHQAKLFLGRHLPDPVMRSRRLRKASRRIFTIISKSRRNAGVAFGSLKINKSNLSNEPASFTSGDIILVLGKPWDTPGLQTVLFRIKKQYRVKIVQVVYDLVIPLYPHLHHPSLFKPYTQNMFEAVSNSNLLLPISESTKFDLRIFSDRLKLTLPPTCVMRLGDAITINSSQETTPGFKNMVGDRFIASIGTIEIRKNHTLLYYAYKLAAERNVDLPKLLIVGGRGWLSNDLQYLIGNDPDIKKKIVILDSVGDDDLAWIYSNCQFTVYPSMYEGWGLPVAESLAYGRFCIASNASSIPEIAGDLIEYFSPYSPEALMYLIEKFTTNQKELVRREKRILREYHPTSWETTFATITHKLEEI